MPYTPPSADQFLALRVNADIESLTAFPVHADVHADLVEAIVDGIGRFAAGTFEPLCRIGDKQGAVLEEGTVRLPDGYAEAYRHFAQQGWSGISAPVAYGGQGLPMSLSVCVLENLGTANLAFSLLPMLTVGAIEALIAHGSDHQKSLYLPKLISGEWTGTMNLTEPQAGSDVGALRTTATPIADGEYAGNYRIKGTKIFITWGEHELAENIVHLVLARLPDAPAGSRGISLFLVPRYLVGADGRPGKPNDLRAISLEHKMGIHASPTCVMSYGEGDACIGEIVGAPNEGLKAMFTMMNSARINVGAQGLAVAEATWQQAAAYARDRIQSPRAGSSDKTPVAIAEHPDVRRMLLRMRALTESSRALLYYACGHLDRVQIGDQAASERADFLVPLVKAWITEIGCEVASLGVQIHGGMGFIEETGVAMHYRNARIAPIYEGTNGIQAADLVQRKLSTNNGAQLAALMEEIRKDCANAPRLAELALACQRIGRWMLDTASIEDRLAGALPFLTMCAVAVAGWQLGRQVHCAQAPIVKVKSVTWNFFCETIVAEALGLETAATAGSRHLNALTTAELTM